MLQKQHILIGVLDLPFLLERQLPFYVVPELFKLEKFTILVSSRGQKGIRSLQLGIGRRYKETKQLVQNQ
jgi:hypothetical protein